MNTVKTSVPDSTAERVALWRAMHVQIDSPPHVLEDEIGLRLANPSANWQQRPDMHPQRTSGYRAGIVARSRFVEDLVLEQFNRGVNQYVILGAGLDTYSQRRPQLAKQLQIFEVDKPDIQEWKQFRLHELGLAMPESLHFVSVDFEQGESWREKLFAKGFSASKPAVVASTGVSMYLTNEANRAALREITFLAKGSTLAMTFLLPLELVDPAERAQHEMVYERARAAGTPFVSFFSPSEIMSAARELDFSDVNYIDRAELIRRYFKGRADDLLPASGEEFLVATV